MKSEWVKAMGLALRDENLFEEYGINEWIAKKLKETEMKLERTKSAYKTVRDDIRNPIDPGSPELWLIGTLINELEEKLQHGIGCVAPVTMPENPPFSSIHGRCCDHPDHCHGAAEIKWLDDRLTIEVPCGGYSQEYTITNRMLYQATLYQLSLKEIEIMCFEKRGVLPVVREK